MATASVAISRRPRKQTRIPVRRPVHRTFDAFLSPDDATAILTKERYERQRPLRPHKIREQGHLLATGHLRPCTPLSFALYGDRRYLVNGQHTLAALQAWDGPGYWFTIEEFTVTREADIATLYTTYDGHLGRTLADRYLATGHSDAYGLSPTQINRLGGAVPILAQGFAQRSYHSYETFAPLLRDFQIRDALIADWSPEMVYLMTSCEGNRLERRYLLRASVLAVALVTQRYQPASAQRFWPALVANSGLIKETPAHTLLDWFRRYDVRKYAPEVYQRYVATAWNAHYETRPLKALHVPTRKGSEPIVLAGTPHTGKETVGYLTLAGDVVHDPTRLLTDEASKA